MENVARVRKRVFAALIDYAIYFVMFAFYIFTFGDPNDSGGYTVNGMKAVPLMLIWFFYFPVMEGLFGQTFGKKVLGVRVTNNRGKDIGIGTSILRRLLDFIDFSFAGLTGLIVMKSSQNNQRIGDHVANTLVIEDKFSRCQFCNEELSLNRHEVETGVFVCPKCNKQNTPLDLVED
jgi:uncharacterized RDD family membrane protein YckC